MNFKKIKLRTLQLYVLIVFFFVMLYCKIFRINNEKVWLISERGDEARDNGFALYKYLKENHPEVNVKYVISRKSEDISRIKHKDDIVYLRSIKHYILFVTSGKLISTHIMGYSPEMRLFNKLESYIKLPLKGKRVFLQHGITQNKIDMFNPNRINIDLFVCGAKPEYDFLLEDSGFDSKVLKYTGFPRYDNLIKKKSKMILIMPTWRAHLFYCKSEKEFKKSVFFKNWMLLLNNKKLNDFLEKNNIKMIFYPHYELQQFIDAFSLKYNNIIVAKKSEYDVQTLLNECLMLITDYSSVFFDVAYMKKPIIYYQFDYGDYRKYHYKEGWFDFNKNGFGPVIKPTDEVVNKIINYHEKEYKTEDKYLTNINDTFVYSDCNNSKRVYNEINRL